MRSYISPSAPFNSSQRKWLDEKINNFIQSLSDQKNNPFQQSEAGQGFAKEIIILFGSQTGNAEHMSKSFQKELKKKGATAQVVDMQDITLEQITDKYTYLIITSTYGDGEPPDNAESFHTELQTATDDKLLQSIDYAVLGIGDSSYPDFCRTAIDFDQYFAKLGANRLMEYVKCDVDYEEAFQQWKKDIVAILSGGNEEEVSDGVETMVPEEHSKSNPFPAQVIQNYNLNNAISERETFHVELDLTNSGLHYETGDALGVLPCNDDALVDEIINHLGFNPASEVTTANKQEVTLREALLYHCDISNITQNTVKKWQAKSHSPYLKALVEGGSREDFNNFLWGRNLIDLIIDYPALFSDADDFVEMLKKLQPRLYSISSSGKKYQNRVHLTVALVKYHSFSRDRKGVCSAYLADSNNDKKVKVFVHSNKNFRLPEDNSKPIIMVGPGTGIAPFRAFIQERIHTKAEGENWLFFGNPYRKLDFLYEQEITQWQQDGHLYALELAFSRDQEHKIYVQDKMREKGAELWQWINSKNASFYVCGDASRMAKDVDQALHDIAQQHGNLTVDEAIEYFKEMKKNKRYCRDVY